MNKVCQPEKYKLVYEGGSGEIIEKKSRFIATVKPVSSESEAYAFIESVKKKYWDARHNCHAFVIGMHQEIIRCSDDGEPAGTAGKPMLDEGLLESTIIEKIPGCRIQVTTDYTGIGKIQYIAAAMSLPILDCQYTDIVVMHVLTDFDSKNAFIKKVTEATSGSAILEELGNCYFAEVNGSTMIFDS